MQAPVLRCPGRSSATGAYRLSWSGGEGRTYRLTENGQVLYEGPDMASTVTGRKAGTYVYRVGVDGAWSTPCRVEVDPPSLGLALGLFGLGFTVFLAVLWVIIRGHRAHRRGERG